MDNFLEYDDYTCTCRGFMGTELLGQCVDRITLHWQNDNNDDDDNDVMMMMIIIIIT